MQFTILAMTHLKWDSVRTPCAAIVPFSHDAMLAWY